MRKMIARRDSTCAICEGPMAPGDEIAMPQVKNRKKGNLYAGPWYCVPCAIDLEEIGAHVGIAPYLNDEARIENEKRCAPAHARIKVRREAHLKNS